MRKAVLIILLVNFCSCKAFYKFATGIRKPKIENKQSISKWIGRHFPQLDTSRILILNPIQFSSFFVVEPFILNKQGNIVYFELRDTERYKFSLNSYLKKKPTDGVDSFFNDLTKEFYETVRTLNGEKVSPILFSNSPIVVIPFAKFFGSKIQKKDIKGFLQDVSIYGKQYKVYLLNFDKLDTWNDSAKARIEFSFK